MTDETAREKLSRFLAHEVVVRKGDRSWDALGKSVGLTKQKLLQIKGGAGVGAEALGKLADAWFDGDLNGPGKAAKEWCATHPPPTARSDLWRFVASVALKHAKEFGEADLQLLESEMSLPYARTDARFDVRTEADALLLLRDLKTTRSLLAGTGHPTEMERQSEGDVLPGRRRKPRGRPKASGRS
jgi:hypothetical protein